MTEESEGRKLLNRLREATANVTQMTKEGVETLQTKRELSQAYSDLGRKAAELVESGAVSHPELTEPVARIGELKSQLADAGEPDEAPAEPDAGSAEPPVEPGG
jgi:hypothetical protein